MDSLTQAALGAVVGHTVLGKHIGRTSVIAGAILGTLPDLDVLISFGGPVEDFTYHRSFSHSLIVQLALAPILSWLIVRLRPHYGVIHKSWFIAILAIFWTHSLLDACTVYGTQLFWPLTEYPFGLSSVFIIDPLYTLPLLIALLFAFKWGWNTDRSAKASQLALLVSTLYLCWGGLSKTIVEDKVYQAWHATKPEKEVISVVSTPMPLNSLLWRIVLDEGSHYSIAHVGLWEDTDSIKFRTYPKGNELLIKLQDQWDVKRLTWFSKGFYKAELRGDQILISDTRMGVEGAYAFNFAIGAIGPDRAISPQKAIKINDEIDWSKLPLVWDRLWDSSISLHPQDYGYQGSGKTKLM